MRRMIATALGTALLLTGMANYAWHTRHLSAWDGLPPREARLRLKVEINSREHFTIYGTQRVPFTVTSRWFNGSCDIHSYELAELLGTKMRALYQRKKRTRSIGQLLPGDSGESRGGKA